MTISRAIAPATLTSADAMPNYLMHIGCHRSGTSFLQTEFFPVIFGNGCTMDFNEWSRYATEPPLVGLVRNQRIKPFGGALMLSVLLCRNRPQEALRRSWPAVYSQLIYRALPAGTLLDRYFGKSDRRPKATPRPPIHVACAEDNPALLASLRVNMANYDYPQLAVT